MATYAIGDIHGRADLLVDLLAKIRPDPSDSVVFLGDYIDRGPDSKCVIDILIEFEARTPATVSFLIGNHEQWLLRTLNDFRCHSWLLGMEGLVTIRSYNTGAAAILEDAIRSAGISLLKSKVNLPYEHFTDSIPHGHMDFFQRLQPFERTPEAVCVHGGVSSLYSRVEEEHPDSLISGEREWWQNYRGEDTIIYGHWGNAETSGLTTKAFTCGNTHGIDGVENGRLLALRLPGQTVFTGQIRNMTANRTESEHLDER